jgi:hypothetical protein
MATAFRVSNAAAKAALDAALALLNAGGGGYIEVRTGSPPTNVEDAATGTLLATCALSATAFPASADAAPGAIATANAITQDASADASGTAGYFRAYATTGPTGVIQGTVGTSSADMIVNTTTVTAGLPFSVSSWTVTLPETA